MKLPKMFPTNEFLTSEKCLQITNADKCMWYFKIITGTFTIFTIITIFTIYITPLSEQINYQSLEYEH